MLNISTSTVEVAGGHQPVIVLPDGQRYVRLKAVPTLTQAAALGVANAIRASLEADIVLSMRRLGFSTYIGGLPGNSFPQDSVSPVDN
jgi:hypothetical protein